MLSSYLYKALYLHPKALNGDTKALYLRSKPSNLYIRVINAIEISLFRKAGGGI